MHGGVLRPCGVPLSSHLGRKARKKAAATRGEKKCRGKCSKNDNFRPTFILGPRAEQPAFGFAI